MWAREQARGKPKRSEESNGTTLKHQAGLSLGKWTHRNSAHWPRVAREAVHDFAIEQTPDEHLVVLRATHDLIIGEAQAALERVLLVAVAGVRIQLPPCSDPIPARAQLCNVKSRFDHHHTSSGHEGRVLG